MQGEVGYGIAVDGTGNQYITGATYSTDFPLQNPYQLIPGGDADVFITKIAPDGRTLIYSTYLGGSDRDHGNHIAVDSAGTAYLTGFAWSPNFPLANAFQGMLRGPSDAFATKLNATGSTLIYSSYLGGTGID